MTAPYYGKRNPGGLIASSPGDTLYFNFGSYNDSGNSEALTGLAVGDVELSKNGSAVVRTTDSGISLISDTGQFGDRAGLYRFRLQLFNTADDTGFFDVGSWYQVAVDSVAIDGKTVRFWAGSFEIGEPRANIVQVNGDTGAANQLENAFANGFNDTGVNDRFAKIQADVDTGLRSSISDVDTGLHDTIADLDTGLRALVADLDTGLRDTMADFDTGVRALLTLRDTGAIATAVWAKDARTLTGWSFDTGVQQAIARLDTGINETIDRILADTDTGIQPLTAAAIADAVWDERDTGHLDTGTFGRLRPALAAVRAKTDSLTFTVAGIADANIQYVNDVQVSGTGDTGLGTPWGPV